MNQEKKKIGIIDYGVGNVFSVEHAFNKLGVDCVISKDEKKLNNCSHLILPGVGAFDEAFRQLESSALIPFLKQVVFEDQKPILGICVGMQLMLESSEENGFHKGLSWIKGSVQRIKEEGGLRLPHVGWNNVEIRLETPFQNIPNESDFYFDHTYYCDVKEDVITSYVDYGQKIPSSIKKNNINGVQFHPEKSQINGLRVFKSFINNA